MFSRQYFLTTFTTILAGSLSRCQSDSITDVGSLGTSTALSVVEPMTATSQIPSATTTGAKSYGIFPKDRTNSSQTNATDKFIQRILGDAPSNIYNSPYRGVSNWAPNLTDDQLKKIVDHPGIDYVIENVKIAEKRVVKTGGPQFRGSLASQTKVPDQITAAPAANLRKRDGQITSQTTSVPTELSVIVQPSNSALADVRNYVYDDVAGENTYIYVIENGINVRHPEFQDMVHPPQDEDWLFVPGASQTYVDSDTELYHGTCVADKAAGADFGVAKESHLVIVKSDDTPTQMLSAYEMALDDIIKNERRFKSVVIHAAGEYSPVSLVFCSTFLSSF